MWWQEFVCGLGWKLWVLLSWECKGGGIGGVGGGGRCGTFGRYISNTGNSTGRVQKLCVPRDVMDKSARLE